MLTQLVRPSPFWGRIRTQNVQAPAHAALLSSKQVSGQKRAQQREAALSLICSPGCESHLGRHLRSPSDIKAGAPERTSTSSTPSN